MLETELVFRPVPGFPAYRIDSDRSVWSRWQRRRGRGNGQGGHVLSDPPVWRLVKSHGGRYQLLGGGLKRVNWTIDRIYRESFGEPERSSPARSLPVLAVPSPAPPRPPEIVYKPLPGFDGFRVGSDRSVWSAWQGRCLSTEPAAWRRLEETRRPGRRPTVVFRFEGRCYHRSVDRLFRDAFTPVAPERPAPLPLGGHLGEPARGSSHGRAKLDEAKVVEARRLQAAGWGYRALSERYGVGRVTLWNAITGRTWGHVLSIPRETQRSRGGRPPCPAPPLPRSK